MDEDPEKIRQFVALVLDKVGAKSLEELAVVLGDLRPSALADRGLRSQKEANRLKTYQNWAEGKYAPSFFPTMGMLSEAGLLAPAVRELFPPDAGAKKKLAESRRVLQDQQRRAGKRQTQDDRERSA